MAYSYTDASNGKQYAPKPLEYGEMYPIGSASTKKSQTMTRTAAPMAPDRASNSFQVQSPAASSYPSYRQEPSMRYSGAGLAIPPATNAGTIGQRLPIGSIYETGVTEYMASYRDTVDRGASRPQAVRPWPESSIPKQELQTRLPSTGVDGRCSTDVVRSHATRPSRPSPESSRPGQLASFSSDQVNHTQPSRNTDWQTRSTSRNNGLLAPSSLSGSAAYQPGGPRSSSDASRAAVATSNDAGTTPPEFSRQSIPTIRGWRPPIENQQLFSNSTDTKTNPQRLATSSSSYPDSWKPDDYILPSRHIGQQTVLKSTARTVPQQQYTSSSVDRANDTMPKRDRSLRTSAASNATMASQRLPTRSASHRDEAKVSTRETAQGPIVPSDASMVRPQLPPSTAGYHSEGTCQHSQISRTASYPSYSVYDRSYDESTPPVPQTSSSFDRNNIYQSAAPHSIMKSNHSNTDTQHGPKLCLPPPSSFGHVLRSRGDSITSGTSIETSYTSDESITNARNRFHNVYCTGRNSQHHIFDVLLDSGATENVISHRMWRKLFEIGAVEPDRPDDGEVKRTQSAVGEEWNVAGSTKLTVHWTNRDNVRFQLRKRFWIVRCLDVEMILKPDTYLDKDVRMDLAADIWPVNDPRRGMATFHNPYRTKAQKEQDKSLSDQKKRENAAQLALDRQSRQQARDSSSGGSTSAASGGSGATNNTSSGSGGSNGGANR